MAQIQKGQHSSTDTEGQHSDTDTERTTPWHLLDGRRQKRESEWHYPMNKMACVFNDCSVSVTQYIENELVFRV